MRMRAIAYGVVGASLLTLTSCQSAPDATLGSPQTLSPGTWLSFPAEAQSTIIRYTRTDGTLAARILISNDTLPYTSSAFVPTGTVAYQDISSNPAAPYPAVSSTFELPPGCDGPPSSQNCNWNYLSNDHDLISTSDGTVYYMAGVGYHGPTTNGNQPDWFAPPQLPQFSTFRSSFGPNERGADAVWKSTDHGQSFQWSSYFDPASYFDGSCAYPQYRGPVTPGDVGVQGAPWDMGGSDGQAVWADPITGKISLTFQCVGYRPSEQKPNWILPTQLDQNADGTTVHNPDNSPVILNTGTPVNETLLAQFDGTNWKALAMPVGFKGWRIGAIPYGHYLLLGVEGSLLTVDTSQSSPLAQVSAPTTPLPQVEGGWPSSNPTWFLSANILYNNILTRWGHAGYAFAYANNNAASGQNPTYGYVVYYLTMPDPADGAAPNPRWADIPTQINPVFTGGMVVEPTAIDVGSGTTLLYWYDINQTNQMASIRGRFLYDYQLYSQDFEIAPAFSVLNPVVTGCNPSGKFGACPFFGDYKTAGGYCWNDGKNVTSVYFPIWTNPGNGSANYVSVSSTSSLAGITPLAPSCMQKAPTQESSGNSFFNRAVGHRVSLQKLKVGTLSAGTFADPRSIKRIIPPPDRLEHSYFLRK